MGFIPVYFQAVRRNTEGWMILYIGARQDGRNTIEYIGLVASEDGIHWTRYEGNPIFWPGEVIPAKSFTPWNGSSMKERNC